MAVIIEAFDVVALVDPHPGAMGNFRSRVPNGTYCSDGRLMRASFLTEVERTRFVRGLCVSDASRVAVVDHGGTEASLPTWLAVGDYAGAAAAWLRDDNPDPLVVPLAWSPKCAEIESAGHAHDLEFVSRQGGVDIYRNARTGELTYARSGASVDVVQSGRLAKLKEEAAVLVRGLVPLEGRELELIEMLQLDTAVAKLRSALLLAPDDWTLHWMLGLTLRVLLRHEEALAHLHHAYKLNGFHPVVGREYAGQCLINGSVDEAVHVSRSLCERFPEDAGLAANLALALLVQGDEEEAERVISRAHERTPDDVTTRRLRELILSVRAGETARPTRVPGW